MHKINIFSPIFLAEACLVGAALSAAIGWAVYLQAADNLNSRADIESAQIQIEQNIQDGSDAATPIGGHLSAYNKKIANAKWLSTLSLDQVEALSDPYVDGLKKDIAVFSKKSFAVYEYGIAAAVGVGVFSLILTASVVWLAMCAAVYLLKRKDSHGNAE